MGRRAGVCRCDADRTPSAGDLWSFNSSNNEYVVSPEPDLDVLTVDVTQHRCLVLGTDGFWNMVSPQMSVSNVAHAELFNEECLINHTNTGEVSVAQRCGRPPQTDGSGLQLGGMARQP